MLRINFSNKVELLFERMKNELFSSETTPFTQRLVIVPSPAMKSWVMLQLAKEENIGIAAGLRFAYLDAAIEELSEQAKKPSPLEIALLIEAEMHGIIESEHRDEIWDPLLNYLGAHEKLTRKGERRMVTLSQKLASLFDRYETFGEGMLGRWKKQGIGGWQGELWRKVISRTTNQAAIQKKDVQVSLFSISFIPRKHHEFLKKYSEVNPVNYFMLSPCQAFWTDVLGDRESRRLAKYWGKQGVSEGQLKALDELLFDRNALLANFGRMGREMAELLEEGNVETNEDYQVSSGVQSFSQYHDYLYENVELIEKKTSLSMLEAVQADLLMLRNPFEQEKLSFTEDQSIQVHVASSKMREVQILYNTLMNVMDIESVCPGDIIVMAPDISIYEPYIRAVFNEKVDFQIMDLHLLTQHPLIQGFMHMISLPFSRWDVISILQLLEYGSFKKKCGFSADDAHRIKGWVREAGVRWGGDRVHREELLQRNHCDMGMVEETAIGTWEHGLDRLLYGWIMRETDSEEVNASMDVVPVEAVDLTQGELLGRWMQVLKSLKHDLQELTDGSRHTLQEWTNALSKLLDTYFTSENSTEEESKEQILEAIKSFGKLSRNNNLYSFTSIKFHLESILNRQRVCYREPHLQAIRFCSLLPMRALPAQVIVLLGMEEGAFPRQDQVQSLNCLANEIDADYCPTQTNFDRYLFLEILMSARRKLIVSYTGNDKDQSPSLLIAELMNYLDAAYILDGEKPSKKCMIKHPFKEFDSKYFDGTLPNFSQESYLAACAYYGKIRKKRHQFVPQFKLGTRKEVNENRTIDLRNLIAMARNPVEAYFNRTLGIYLEKEEDKKIKSEEDFVLQNLQGAALKKASLKTPFAQIIQIAEKEGKLPLGAFKELAIGKIEKEVHELYENLLQAGVNKDKVIEIEFSELHQQPFQKDDGSWNLPPLEINYKKNCKIKVVGKLSDVYPEGFLGYIKDEKGDVTKVWPQYLVYNGLCEKYGLKLGRKLIFAKTGVARDPFFNDFESLLAKYLDYYFIALESVSPLIPEWVPEIVKSDISSFEKKVKSNLSDQSKYFYNDYIRWMMKGSEGKSGSEIYENWKSIALNVYGELYENWYQ